MNSGVKLILYVILVIAVLVTGALFFKNFGKLFAEEKPAIEASAEPSPEPAPAPADTNAVIDTNAAAITNAVADTNAVASVTNNLTDTNLTAETSITNAPPETNAVAKAKTPTKKKSKRAAANPATGEPDGPSHIGLWTGSFILSVIALGALIAWDVSNFMGNRTLKVLYNDDNASHKDPEYEEAEKIWADGQHLEAVRLMRDYYNKNPREVHVALRIAEIYEKDLNPEKEIARRTLGLGRDSSLQLVLQARPGNEGLCPAATHRQRLRRNPGRRKSAQTPEGS
jgi:hypothetical protein